MTGAIRTDDARCQYLSASVTGAGDKEYFKHIKKQTKSIKLSQILLAMQSKCYTFGAFGKISITT